MIFTRSPLDFGRAEVFRIDLDQCFPGQLVHAFLFCSCTFPPEDDTGLPESQGAEFPDRMLFPGSYHIVFRRVMLEHEPHALHIVFCIAPVPSGIQISEI